MVKLTNFLSKFMPKWFYEISTWDRIHNPSFSSELPNDPNKLESLITLGFKGLLVTKALAFWVHS
jgi:hypothetical protein